MASPYIASTLQSISSPSPSTNNLTSGAVSLTRLTSISTSTLTLLLERQRLASINRAQPSSPTSSTLSPSTSINGLGGVGVEPTPNITKNLKTLRDGILSYEKEFMDESSLPTAKAVRGRKREVEAETRELRSQFRRMRGMLAIPDEVVEDIEELEISRSPSPSPELEFGSSRQGLASYMPYKDDPDALERGPDDGEVYQMNEQIMTDQDTRLEHLSSSINRQHSLSLQINDELDTHTGLLEGLDGDLDKTSDRLSKARRQLDKVAKGVKGNGAIIFMVLIIAILLLLIVIFKT